MTVKCETARGMRYGTFNIRGISGKFPTQAITSTNLQQRKMVLSSKNMSQKTKTAFQNLDFGTSIVEIIEFNPHKLVSDPNYRKKQVQKNIKTIKDNKGYLFLFTLQGIKSSKKGTKLFPFTRKNNEILINFQLECGFDLIRVFFRNKQNVDDQDYYRGLIPQKQFMACLDENMSRKYFEIVYVACRERGDEVISFLGRKPSTHEKNPYNKANFIFVWNNIDDEMIRVTSSIPKSSKEVVNSLVYKWHEIDVMSFSTRRGNPKYRGDYDVKALDKLRFVSLVPKSGLNCAITGKDLYEATQEFLHIDSVNNDEYNGSSIPISVHDIVSLNKQLRTLHREYTREQLKSILGDRV